MMHACSVLERQGDESVSEQISVPNDVISILSRMNAAGYEAYAVGGCIRDAILGFMPHDWDICTDAAPTDVLEIFSDYKVIPTGLKHGTVSVVINDAIYEITTYRLDGKYLDHRRPETVQFVKSLEEDLKRRDFTINAMAYHPNAGIIDLFEGKKDLSMGRIRCVGDPYARFEEDGLRILRALRFASRFKYQIEKETSKAIHDCRELLSLISVERVFSELKGILSGPGASEILRSYSDIFFEIMPELRNMKDFDQHSPYHLYDVWEHTLHALEYLPDDADMAVRIGVLFHDCGKPERFFLDSTETGHFYGHAELSTELLRSALHRLKCDNQLMHDAATLVTHHHDDIHPDKKRIRKILSKLGEENFRRLLLVMRADSSALAPTAKEGRIEELLSTERILEEILRTNECFTLRDLAISGKDLLRIGFPQGKNIGILLNELLNEVISESLPNNSEILLEWAVSRHEDMLR